MLGSSIFDFGHTAPFTPDGRSVVYAGNDRDAAAQDVLIQARHEGHRMHVGGPWAADSSAFLLLHDTDREFRALGSYSLTTGAITDLVTPPRDVEPELVRSPTHDGPEAQERPQYNYSGLYQYLVSLGVAVLAPNVRGSTGYGKTYQRLICATSAGRSWATPTPKRTSC